MNVGPDSDYRAGLFWLLVGGGFVMMGLAQLRWLGIQPWYLYALGIGLIIVAAILAPRKVTADRLRWGWLPLVIGLVVSIVIAVLSAEVHFGEVLPLVSGLLWMGSGLWLMVRRETPAGD
mgnify:CR=1 FL=1